MQTTTTTTQPGATLHHPDPATVHRAIEKRSFATLATTSPAGRPHVAGVLYEAVSQTDGHTVLYVNTLRVSRKARNVLDNPNVAMVVPIRRLPIGPPASVQFQTEAAVLDLDHPEIRRLVAGGQLSSITGHGELDLRDGCFLRVPLPARLVTYGLGMSLRRLISEPLSAGGIVDRGTGR